MDLGILDFESQDLGIQDFGFGIEAFLLIQIQEWNSVIWEHGFGIWGLGICYLGFWDNGIKEERVMNLGMRDQGFRDLQILRLKDEGFGNFTLQLSK